MPDVLEFASLDLARCHRQALMLAFQRLHTRQFIRAYRAFPRLRSRWCLTIDRANLANRLGKMLILGRGQPIAAEVRFVIPFVSWREA